MEKPKIEIVSLSNGSREDAAVHLLHAGDLDAAWRAAEEGIQTAGIDRTLRRFWIFRFVRAEVLRVRGNSIAALEYLNSLLPPSDKDIENRAALTMHRGYCSALLGHCRAGLDLLEEARLLASGTGLAGLRGEITARQAMIAYLQRDYYTSERLYKSVGETCGLLFGWYLYCIARGGVGKSLSARREYQKAVPFLEEAVEVATAAGSKLLMAGFSGEAAICYLWLGDPGRALKIHSEAAGILAELGARHAYQVSLAEMGNVFLHKGEYLTAISHYQRALTIAREIHDPVSIEKWSFNIRLVYEKCRQSIGQQAAYRDMPSPLESA
jgi:tetratricopeptide (TPR) repeat protein